MAKEIKKIRFGLKAQPLSEYEKVPNFVPINGEMCFIKDYEGFDVAYKLGDGVTKFADLPVVYKVKSTFVVFSNNSKLLPNVVDGTGEYVFEAEVPYDPKYAVVEVKQIKDFNTGKVLDNSVTIDTGVQVLRSFDSTTKKGTVICKFNSSAVLTEIPIGALEVTVVPN